MVKRAIHFKLYQGINTPLNFRYNFCKTCKFNCKIHLEKQRTQNCQNDLKQNKVGGFTYPYFKAYLQSQCNQGSVALTYGYTYSSMEQN